MPEEIASDHPKQGPEAAPVDHFGEAVAASYDDTPGEMEEPATVALAVDYRWHWRAVAPP